MPELTLVVLAAGMGSRYGGLKQVDPIGPSGETILDYSVYDAIREGFDKVVFVIREEMREDFAAKVANRFSDRIEVAYAIQRMDDLPAGFEIPQERSKPWGTAHAMLAARDEVTTPFAVLNADDFYGRDAFAKVARFFGQRPVGGKVAEHAMVGFTLRNTLSEHGTVARGICSTTGDGYLDAVEELTAIAPVAGGGARNEAPGQERDLGGDEVASMNFWGFSPVVFEQVWEVFSGFLEADPDLTKREFYIPTAVDQLIHGGSARVTVLRSDGDWFGVTYREDRPRVAAAMASLVDGGAYPSSLWD